MLLERTVGMDIDNIDDTAALGLEVRRRGLGEEEGRLEIGAHQIVPVLFGNSADRSGVESRGVVDQNIEPAPGGIGLLHQLRQGGGVMQVALHQ